jgi:hypothetical protein
MSKPVDRVALVLIWTIAALLILLPVLTNERKPRVSRSLDFVFIYGGCTLVASSRSNLYVPRIQRQMLETIAPLPTESGVYGYFMYPPFVPLVFSPLSHLSYWHAYRVYQAISAVLYLFGLFLLIRRFISHDASLARMMIPFALAYLPFIAYTWVSGQLSVVGFVAIAMALSSLKKGNLFRSGLALSLCCYKPTLLILLLPMLLFRRQFRSLFGFATGAVTLVLAAAIAYGWQIWVAYMHFLRYFAGDMERLRTLMKYADLTAFFSLLLGPRSAPLLALLCGLAMLPLLIRSWRYNNDSLHRCWASTLTWTMVLGPYVPLYDTTLIIPSMIVSSSQPSFRLHRFFAPALLMVFACSWISEELVLLVHLQLLTVAIAIFGWMQLRIHMQSGSQAVKMGPEIAIA